MSSNQLNDISNVYMEAVYGGAKKEKKDTRLVVTNADKKANTKAYQNYKAGNKAYKAADHLNSEGYQRDPERQEKDRKRSKQTDPSKDNFTGIGDSIEDIMKQNAAMKKAAAKKAKKEELEFARHKGSVISRGGRLEDAVESWNQKLAYREAMKEVSEKKEVNVKDTYKTVAAIVDYDRSKKGSEDATWDSEHGKKKAAKKEKDYAAWERGKMKKDDPNWKSKKYHTGMHGEEKRWQDDDGDGKWYEKSDVDGKISKREKKSKKHDCASKVKHEEFGIGNPLKGMHDLDESGRVAHYDVLFGHGVEKNVPVSSLEILEGHMHEHVIREKMADKDYDGDGKIESGKDEYFGSKDKAIKKAMGKKVKKESLSDWRDDLSDLIEIVAGPEDEVEKKVKEGKVKNKVVINPKISEAIEEIGGEVLEHHQKDADGNTVPHDDVEEGKMYGYKGGGVVKKEVKALSTAARTMKGRNVAKADKIEEGTGKKNCGCGQNPCITYGEQKEVKSSKKSQVEGYQRHPERDTRSARQRRMDDPDKGINSQAFRDFMAAQQRPSKPKKKKEVKENIFSKLVEADKKGKGSGTKDACYNKVKASAKVWPSAYASGRLVQCRKKGAANYGKGSD